MRNRKYATGKGPKGWIQFIAVTTLRYGWIKATTNQPGSTLEEGARDMLVIKRAFLVQAYSSNASQIKSRASEMLGVVNNWQAQ